MKYKTAKFCYRFRYAGQKDTAGLEKTIRTKSPPSRNGIFAVSDGMGGLEEGARASHYVRESIPAMMRYPLKEAESSEAAGRSFAETVRMISDELFRTANTEAHIGFGATFCGYGFFKTRRYLRTLGQPRLPAAEI
jgi:serine/threonine protein phosphatase PrpC